MAHREFRLPRPEPKPATYHPAVREAGVERQGTVDQFDGRIDILAKIGKRPGRVAEHIRIFGSRAKRPAGEIYPFPAGQFGVIDPAVDVKILMAPCRER